MRLILADPDQRMDQAADLTWKTRDQENGPLRRCLVTRAVMPKQRMLRFVVGPEANLIFDIASTLPGRGLWLNARQDMLNLAIRNGTFSKAAKQRIVIPDGLADHVTALLERRIVELLGLTRRSGTSLAGFEKVREMLGAGHCAALVEACDGSLTERSRLLNGRDIPVFTPLNAARLGAAFGRDTVTHIGLAPGRLAGMISLEATRLAGMNGGAETAVEIAIPGKRGQRDARSCLT